MKEYCSLAIDTAKLNGASYADIRIIESWFEDLSTRNGNVANITKRRTLGFGVRVICNGAWGFASSSTLNRDEIQRVAKLATKIGFAGSTTLNKPVVLAPEGVYVDTWQTPVLIDPFTVPIEEKFDLLFALDTELRKNELIKSAYASISLFKERQWMMTSEGSYIDQMIVRTGTYYSATAVKDGEQQVRSFPASHGGQCSTMGWELVKALPLLAEAPRIREEAVALLSAPPCPSGKTTLILDPTQLSLQIHESTGHASELDRVLGMEANYAGTSFLTTEKKGVFKYGSPIVNLVADSTVPTGLATIGYDDDAVPAKRWYVVREGIFQNYFTNRELAHVVNDARSWGCNRAENFYNIPIIRIPNLSLMPGDWKFADLIADTDDGVYMINNRSWSIDQRRLNFQFGTEIAYEVKNGKLGRMLKNPTYQSITPEFWGSCDAICDKESWELWGVPNCGKGQPGQRAEMSHGSSPARFRNVTVGVGN